MGVEVKWEHIGRELRQHKQSYYAGDYDFNNYSPGDIRSKCFTAVDCLRETISQWLKWAAPPTWSTLIVALRSTVEPQVADNLKAKYIPGELTTTTSSQYSLESQHGENEMM